ncbi:hypothetical protein GCM10023188_48250 [Pontibacter saemangeumensis]|uniref:Polyketide cyclase / dehydrase and lipid transport n=1 Tax=Pontibacter saemangeumensis TaxID=1084525 RepID=A0ABP8M7S6_9BACT
MKLLFKVLLPLPVLLAAAAGAAYYLLPAELEVQQAIVLQAPPEEVYALLDNPMEWQKWSVLNKQEDPSMIHLYGGPMAGAGARMQWSGDRVGNGQVVFTESISPSSLTYRQSENGAAENILGSFTLAPVAGGTQVVWKQQAVVGQSPWQKVLGAVQKYRKQDEVEKGLLGLKTLLLNNSKKKAVKTRTAYADHH